MNDCDTEFIAPEEIKLTDNPDNASVLTPEANFHVVAEGPHIIKNQRQTKREKKLKKYPNHMETQCFFTFWRELSSGGQSFLPIWWKCFSFQYLSYSWCFDWITCSTKWPLFATKQNELSQHRRGNESFHCCKPIAKHTRVLELQSFRR